MDLRSLSSACPRAGWNDCLPGMLSCSIHVHGVDVHMYNYRYLALKTNTNLHRKFAIEKCHHDLLQRTNDVLQSKYLGACINRITYGGMGEIRILITGRSGGPSNMFWYTIRDLLWSSLQPLVFELILFQNSWLVEVQTMKSILEIFDQLWKPAKR